MVSPRGRIPFTIWHVMHLQAENPKEAANYERKYPE
jgi:hypothetical protein